MRSHGIPRRQAPADHRVLSNRSIAYGIARACHREGAELRSATRASAFKRPDHRVRREFGSTWCSTATSERRADRPEAVRPPGPVLAAVRRFRALIGFAPARGDRGRLRGRPVARELRIAHDISAYSFPALAKACAAPPAPGAALLTLTYRAGVAVPNYKHDGLAKASLEASVRYLAVHLGPKRACASTASRPARSRRWPPRASRASAASWTSSSATPAAPQRDDRRRRQRRRLPAVRTVSVARRTRKGGT